MTTLLTGKVPCDSRHEHQLATAADKTAGADWARGDRMGTHGVMPDTDRGDESSGSRGPSIENAKSILKHGGAWKS